MKIGVIAEEKNDVEVLYELTCKLVRRSNFSFKKFVGRGCGTLRKKCNAWAKNLFQQGCKYIVVLHDLDFYDESTLRRKLCQKIEGVGFCGYIVLLPKREIEAWLLVDADALRTVFNMVRAPKVPNRPENIADPKKKLKEIVRKCAKKTYLHKEHNKKIAAELDITKLGVCPSFRTYPAFIDANVCR